MSHFLTRLGLVALCSLFFGWVLAGDGPQPFATQVSASAPTALAPRFYGDAPPPEIDAAAYLVFDTATGERLAAHAAANRDLSLRLPSSRRQQRQQSLTTQPS